MPRRNKSSRDGPRYTRTERKAFAAKKPKKSQSGVSFTSVIAPVTFPVSSSPPLPKATEQKEKIALAFDIETYGGSDFYRQYKPEFKDIVTRSKNLRAGAPQLMIPPGIYRPRLPYNADFDGDEERLPAAMP